MVGTAAEMDRTAKKSKSLTSFALPKSMGTTIDGPYGGREKRQQDCLVAPGRQGGDSIEHQKSRSFPVIIQPRVLQKGCNFTITFTILIWEEFSVGY